MSNPYASPQYVSNVAAEPEERQKLRRVAKYQQWVLYALLGQIGVNVAILGGRAAGFDAVPSLIAIFAGLPVAIFAMVAVFLLGREVYNSAVGVVCAILMLLPCIALLTLLVVNGKATSYLQARGVKVGLMGANLNTI
jgi:hypothetical protein